MTDRTSTLPSPTYRRQTGELVPRILLRAMLGLALSAFAITSFAVLTGSEPVAQPEASTALRDRWLVLEGHDAQAVTVRTPDGAILVDLPHGGFVTVVQSGLATERKKYGVDPLRPVRLVEYANGRLAIEDPDTGWSIELYAFGGDNKAAFLRLFDQE